MLIPGSVVKAIGKEKLFTKRPTRLGFPVFRHVLLAAMVGQGLVRDLLQAHYSTINSTIWQCRKRTIGRTAGHTTQLYFTLLGTYTLN